LLILQRVNTMSLKLYGYWRSSASYRVRIALNLKAVKYEYIPIHLVKNGGEQRTQSYRLLNPSMLVPTLVDEDRDITLNQSLAIIEYLDEVYPEVNALLPQHTVDRAWVRMLAQDIACDVQPLANLRVLNKLKLDYNVDDIGAKKWAFDYITAGFEALEKRLVTRAGKYAYGYSVTLADICIVPQVYNALRFDVDINQFPIINKVYQNCQRLDAFINAAPENQLDAI
jgi:maleylacetoacetate isomerase